MPSLKFFSCFTTSGWPQEGGFLSQTKRNRKGYISTEQKHTGKYSFIPFHSKIAFAAWFTAYFWGSPAIKTEVKYEKESKLSAHEGACNTWALELAEGQTALLLQMLPPHLWAGLGKVRPLGLKSFHFSPPCTKLACLPRDSLFGVCTPLYITWP